MQIKGGRRHWAAAVIAVGLALGISSAPAQAVSDRLGSGSTLHYGESLMSANGQHELFLGSVINDGLYIVGDSCSAWFLHDFGETAPVEPELRMQTDGNLVLYMAGRAVWSSRTAGNPGAYAVMQSDNNVVVYSAAGRALWNAGAVCNIDYNSDDFIGDQMQTEFRAGHFMQSPDRRYRLVLQSDGNLVLYSPTRAIWSSGTAGNPGAVLRHQTDNNVVLYSKAGKALWSTRTGSNNQQENWQFRSYLSLQNDGNLVLYRESRGAVWSTRTAGRG